MAYPLFCCWLVTVDLAGLTSLPSLRMVKCQYLNLESIITDVKIVNGRGKYIDILESKENEQVSISLCGFAQYFIGERPNFWTSSKYHNCRK
jgi:hypothetical protein